MLDPKWLHTTNLDTFWSEFKSLIAGQIKYKYMINSDMNKALLLW